MSQSLEPLVAIATNLCGNIASQDRYDQLIEAVARMLPCDSAALLRLEDDDVLIPAATTGLVPEALGARFEVASHPRLARVLATEGPVRFGDCGLPDPFDGLIATGEPISRVHACLGCALRVDGEVVGVLVADALEPTAFDRVPDAVVETLAALAAAAIRTALLVDALEARVERSDLMLRQLSGEVQHHRGGQIVGAGAAITALRQEISLVAASDLTVLIGGETGVGKELVARAIHHESTRRGRPLVYVNCAALPESIAEDELFGHVRGAFTGASGKRAGKFEAADGGTILLDEIGELPLSIQPKLLRVLQTRELQRVGSDRQLTVDVRVLAATNRDLREEVEAGRFRADLFHRLSVYPIEVPPLRQRREDIPILAGHFLGQLSVRFGVGRLRLAPEAAALLAGYTWPGNVRELEHMLTRASLKACQAGRADLTVIEAAHLDIAPQGSVEVAATIARSRAVLMELTLPEATDDFRRRLIGETLNTSDGNWSEAARRLGVNRGNLHRMGKRLGIRG